MVILLLSFLLLFQTASGMTDTKEPNSQDREHVLQVAFELSLGKKGDSKKVEQHLKACVDGKTAMQAGIDKQGTPILSHAVRHGHG